MRLISAFNLHPTVANLDKGVGLKKLTSCVGSGSKTVKLVLSTKLTTESYHRREICKPDVWSARVLDKNSWDTSTQRYFFTSGPSPRPPNVIAVNSPNLAHQHSEGKKTARCPNSFD